MTQLRLSLIALIAAFALTACNEDTASTDGATDATAPTAEGTVAPEAAAPAAAPEATAPAAAPEAAAPVAQ